MNIVNNFIFDSDRLIFYKNNLPIQIIDKIFEDIPASDEYLCLKNTLDKLDKNKMTAKGKTIDLIGICITYNCNLRCNYCSYSSTNGHKDLLSSDDVVAFVSEAIKSRKIYNIVHKKENDNPLRFFFTGGGEPTLNWSLFTDIVTSIKNICNKYRIRSYLELTTNGMINSEQQKFICKNFDKVMVSYDGIDVIQNENRKSANSKISADIVEETLKQLIDGGIPVTIRTTVWQKDFDKLKDMYDNIVNKFPKANEWNIMPILPAGRALDCIKENEYDCENGFSFFDYFIDIVRYSKQSKENIYVSTPLFINSIADYCCGETFNECYWLMPNKTINSCIEAERYRNDIGCIKENKVIFYEQYHDSHLDEVKNSFSSCRECIAYRFCKGGCPLKSIRDRDNNTTYKAYECNMVKRYWKYVFEEVLDGKECFGWRIEPVNNDIFGTGNVYKLIQNT